MPAKGSKRHHNCAVCRHPDRIRIEMARLGGASLSSVAERFGGFGKDALWRHMSAHVSDDRKAALICDVPLADLAAKAAEEDLSLLDHLAIVRSTVVGQMIGAASMNDRHGVANLAGRSLDVLREIGKLTGQIREISGNVTNNNTLVLLSSPAFVRLEAMLLERLSPYPEAMRAVLEGLRDLDDTDTAPTIELAPVSLPANGSTHARFA
jgi:hypothetical protein